MTLMGRSLTIQYPKAFRPLLKPARYKGAHGGRGSGKSHFFAELLIIRCLTQPGTRAVCIREVQNSLEQSVKRLLEDKIQQFWLGNQFVVQKTQIETPGGGLIIFQGMQNHTADSIKSLEGYDIAWVEEAQSLSNRSLTLLRPTIRKEGSELWFSWNPRHATDPVDVLLRGESTPPDAVVVKATWRDNPWFPGVLRSEMEWDRRDPEKYSHVWGGEHERHSEARVFKNWTVWDFDTPADAAFLFGGDWGFANDPTVLVRSFIVGRDLFIDAEVFKVGCEIDDTPALFDSLGCSARTCGKGCTAKGHGMARQYVITADSARPETISYCRRHGYPRIVPARKGPGSVEEGVTFLQNYNINVHPRCKHAIDELTNYRYKTDQLSGQVLPVLEDKKNHVIDSLRYSVESVRKRRVDSGNVAVPILGQESGWSEAGYPAEERESQ
jgi:phage terminase large subunit